MTLLASSSFLFLALLLFYCYCNGVLVPEPGCQSATFHTIPNLNFLSKKLNYRKTLHYSDFELNLTEDFEHKVPRNEGFRFYQFLGQN